MGLTNSEKSWLWREAKAAVTQKAIKKNFLERMEGLGFKRTTAAKYFRTANFMGGKVNE